MNFSSEESVVPIIREYRDLFMEQQGIQTDIRNYRKRFDKRIKELKTRMQELERDLLVYMKEYDHPGLRFQEVVLLQEDKLANKNIKIQEEEMQTILHRHRVDPTNPLYRELLDSMQNRKIRQGEKKLKLKIYKKESAS